MNEVPTGWVKATIGAIARIETGSTPPKKNASHYGRDICFFKPGDLDSGGLLEFSEDMVTTKGAAAGRLLPPNTVLVTCIGNLGKSGIISTPSICNQQINAILPTPVASPWFIYYWTRTIGSWLEENSSATTISIINKGRFSQAPISIPPLIEQHRIVARLDSLTGRTALAREELGRIPRLVQKCREAILATAFSGELTREWLQTHVPKRVDDDIGSMIRRERDAQRAKAGIRPKGRNRSITGRAVTLPAIPLQWAWVTFDDCAWDLTVGHVGPMKDRYVASGIPFLRSLNIKPNQIDWQSTTVFIDRNFHTELSKSRLRPGDLVVVRTGEPGVAAVVPQSLTDSNCSDLVIGRLIRSMNPHYAAFYMNSEFAKAVVRDAQVGVAQQHFNVGSMSEMPVPWAPTAEQEEIVRKIEMVFAWLDRVAAEHANASRLLPKLDQAILAKAFRGELVLSDRQPRTLADVES
jgi:type I restriction enzyme S subunit